MTPANNLSTPTAGSTGGAQPQRIRRVAVIGVHGVAHHDPGETANAMADLLLSLPSFDPKQAGKPCSEQEPREYEHFDSKGLQIPLRPVCLGKDQVRPERSARVAWVPGAFRLQEGSYKFALHLAKETGVGKTRGEIGRHWSIQRLQDYYGAGDGNGNKYETTRLEGRRANDKTEVHIYEMFWADLARPANNVLSFFVALFQLVLHLPSLSRLAIESRPNPNTSWRIFQAFHRYASRMLQIALPLAKLVLLIVLAAAIPAVTSVKNLDLLSAIVLGVVAAIVLFLVMNYLIKPVFKSRTRWLVASFVLPILVTLGLAAYFIAQRISKNANAAQAEKGIEVFILAGAIWLLGAGLMWWAIEAYQKIRPGISGYGWLTFGVSLVGFSLAATIASFSTTQTDLLLQQASFWTVQWILVALRLSWIFLALFAILSSISGAIAWRCAGPATEGASWVRRVIAWCWGGSSNEIAKARAAVRTSRFALAMPAFLFVLVTSFIWAGLFSLGQRISDPHPFFHDIRLFRNVTPPEWVTNLRKYLDVFPGSDISTNFPQDCETPKPKCSGPDKNTCSCADTTHDDYLRGVLAWSVGPGSYVVTLITLAGLIILIWWALPSVLTETFPPRRDYDWYVKHGTEPPRNSTNRDSMWMGAWTSRGLDSISLVTWLSWFAIFLVPLVFMYLGPPWQWHYLALLRAHSEQVNRIVICRVIAVVSTTAILATIVHYSSSALRVILDVDTYLRTGPIEAPPRAKIFERYVSLLRHVANYKGADGRPYDRVVIVAHSLGALISGDLLNLLRHEKNDPGLQELDFGPKPPKAKIPIRLFTMGNPLRQLLNRFFPYLYDWVRDNPDNGVRPLPTPPQAPPSGFDSDLPAPADLGVELWMNAYRSGDYVGRSLWLDEWYKRTINCSENGIYPEKIYKVPPPEKDATEEQSHPKNKSDRVEFCIGAGAHTHYWDDTAPDIAEALNELINP